MFKKMIYALPLIIGASFSAYAETNDITFTSKPAVLDMPCSAFFDESAPPGPNQTQVLAYTVKNNTSSNIQIKSNIEVSKNDNSSSTSRITGGTCNATDGGTFSLDKKDSCSIFITLASDNCDVFYYLDDDEVNIDRSLKLDPQTAGNSINSNIQLTVAYPFTQVAFIANSLTNIVTICPIDSTYSDFDYCFDSEETFPLNPVDVIVNNDSTLAYIALTNNEEISGNENISFDQIAVCSIDPNLATFSDCIYPTAEQDQGFDFESAGLRLNADNTKIYATNYELGAISVCSLDSNGQIKYPCSFYDMTTDDTNDDTPIGRVSFNAANGSLGYIANSENSDVTICDLNTNDDCYDFYDSNSTIVFPGGSDIGLTGQWVYFVTELVVYDPIYDFYYDYAIANCSVNPSTGDLDVCDYSLGNPLYACENGYGICDYSDMQIPDEGNPAYFGFYYSSAVNIFMHNTNGYAYIPTTSDGFYEVCGDEECFPAPQDNIAICQVDLATGLLYSETCIYDYEYNYYINNESYSNQFAPTSVWVATLPEFCGTNSDCIK
ncbi:MAG: hypothetical protein ABSF18_00235 [Gammaproteobacteria bacterium]|jgi:hypothetical protein